MRLLGVDTGGTFTDFVYLGPEGLRVHKLLSTPEAPERAILAGIAEMGLAPEDLLIVHGSTVATNAVLEAKGVRTVYVTNRGLADVLSIGRQARRELYNLQPEVVPPPVPPELCLETGGRLGADASVVEPLTEADLGALRAELERLAPRSVAINLLFSFLDDAFERRIEAAVPAGIFVSRSSRVLPEYREYERGIATWLNAYVGPLMERYLERLQAALEPARLTVMQSHGGTVGAQQAAGHAVSLLLSGPAGGLIGARFVAGASGRSRMLSFDMGGTSTDVALLDGEPRLTSEGHIAGYPVAVPMVDMHTIGAGGGSIARVDEGGLLQVGPESAGADPGPACYRRGGSEPTVTDANLILGRLPEGVALGGHMGVDPEAARQAMAPLARRLGLSIEQAALGVIRVANEHMAQALRVISVRRGVDPAGFTLLPFGGAGGLHACEIADLMGMDEILIPAHGGVLSALGMLAARPGRQLSRTLNGPLGDFADADIAEALQRLALQGREELAAEGIAAVETRHRLDLRYLGQASTLTLDWLGVAQSAAAFHEAHEAAFGHCLDAPVELVNIRVGLLGPERGLELPGVARTTVAEPAARVRLCGVEGTVPVFRREALGEGQRLVGPSLVSEAVSTTYLAAGWVAVLDRVGNLLVRRRV
ncbi:MAG: hydantoinase/oxoprolinase family protein [Chromatiales bacterium]|jgi:N-methylhydantoinase A